MKDKLLYFIFILVLTANIGVCQSHYSKNGKASYYSDTFHGRKTANGEIYNKNELTAAHRSLAFNSKVKVTNLKNDKSVIVRINDRGPFGKGRIIDLSRAAAQKIDMIQDGVVKVKVESIDYQDNTPSVGAKKAEDNQKTGTSNQFAVGNTYSMWGTEKNPKGHGVQIGSFSMVSNAKNLCSELIEQSYEEVYIQVAWISGRKIYRVLVGAFSTKRAAKEQLKVLTSLGYDGFVKRHFE